MPIALCALASCCRPYIRVLLPYLNGLFFRVKRQININEQLVCLTALNIFVTVGVTVTVQASACLSTCLPGEVNGT